MQKQKYLENRNKQLRGKHKFGQKRQRILNTTEKRESVGQSLVCYKQPGLAQHIQILIKKERNCKERSKTNCQKTIKTENKRKANL